MIMFKDMYFLRIIILFFFIDSLYGQEVVLKLANDKIINFEPNFLDELPVLQYYDSYIAKDSQNVEIIDLKNLFKTRGNLNLSLSSLRKLKHLIKYKQQLKEENKPPEYILNEFNKYSLNQQINLVILSDFFGNLELSRLGSLSIANKLICVNESPLNDFRRNVNFYRQISYLPPEIKQLIAYYILNKNYMNYGFSNLIMKICKRLMDLNNLINSPNKTPNLINLPNMTSELVMNSDGSQLGLLTKTNSKLRVLCEDNLKEIRNAKNSKCICYSNDGNYMAICSECNNIYISGLQVENSKPIILNRILGNSAFINDPIISIGFSYDSDFLIALTEKEVYIIDFKLGNLLKKISFEKKLFDFIFSFRLNHANYTIVLTQHGSIEIINLNNFSNECIFNLNIEPGFVCSYKNKYLAIIHKQKILLFDIVKNCIIKDITVDTQYKKIMFSKISDDAGSLSLVCLANNSNLNFWNIQAGICLAKIDTQIKDFVLDKSKLICLTNGQSKLKIFNLGELSHFLSSNEYLLEQVLFLLAIEYAKHIKIKKEKQHIQEIYCTFNEQCKEALNL